MSDSPIDLTEPTSIRIVGVGGAGMSAIAIILARMGHRVSGVDVGETGAYPALRAAGVSVGTTARADFFAVDDSELIAHSSAFPPTERERARVESSGQLLVDRATILAAICARRTSLGVAGTHGKTSTTAMLATLLEGADADPSYLIGAVPVGLGRAARWASADGLFVVEADESDGSFLELGVSTAIVTNVDEDHLDRWGDLDAIEAAFDRYVGAAERSIVCIDDPAGGGHADDRASRIARRHGSVTVGEATEARFRLHDIVVDRLETTFGLTRDGEEIGPVRIGTPGRHQARNAAVAIATAIVHGVDPAAAVDAISAYRGVARRFEPVGRAGSVTVVDDYAHNPNKIRAVIDAARDAGWRRIVVIFQPQRFSRVRDQGADFGAALADADLVAVTDVYAAGEEPIDGIDGRVVLDALLDSRPWADTAWTPTLDDAVRWAAHRVRPGDVVLTLGAGDVHRSGPALVERLGGRP